jgi:hypothetical protein
MAKSDEAVASTVEVSKKPVYQFFCFGCDQDWIQGETECQHCGSQIMKNVLITG